MQSSPQKEKDIIEKAVSLLWLFVTGALFGAVVWSCTLGADLDLHKGLSPSRLVPYQMSSNLFFLGGGILNSVLGFYFKRVLTPIKSTVFPFIVWLLVWGLLAYRLESLQKPITRWIFFTLPLAWFVARVWWGGLRDKALGSLPIEHDNMRKHLFVLLTLGAFAVFCWFSLTRHYSFGSGSWDMGCYNHNIWLIAHFKPLISTVLGEVNFIGDHFVPILFLFAPLAYTGFTGGLLVLQSAAVALGVIPIFAITKHRELSPHVGLVVSFIYLFSMGTQSMINFDFHEIALVPLAILGALWALETRHKKIFLLCALIIFLSKESAIIYAAGLGLYAFCFVSGMRRIGFGVAALSLPAFFFVVSVLQPALLEGGPQGMIHLARFKAFGASVPEALANMMAFPTKAFLMLFAPEVKEQTWLVTLGAFGFLPFMAPETFVLMLPNLMERFLSDKREMWGLGFHYSVVWISISAYATLLAINRIEQILTRLAHLLQTENAKRTFRFTIAFWLLLSWAGSLHYAPKAFEFKTLNKKYFSTPAQIEVNKKALLQIPADARVVAQNHFLPFLAYRQFIWQPQNQFFAKADYVILNPMESAWPHHKSHVKRWILRLFNDPKWTLIFSEGTTVVFTKELKSAVKPDLALLRAMPRLKKGR